MRKSGNGRTAPTGIRQTSRVAFFATALGWLMTRGAGRWSLDNKKSEGSRLAPTSAGSLAGNGVLQPLLERLKRLEGLAAGVWTMRKSGSAHVALPGIRQTSRVALFATALELDMKKSRSPRVAPPDIVE